MLKTLLAIAALLCASAAFAAVEVNEANAAELDSIKGIGPATSTRILQARKDGVFKDWPDLLRRVKGLNPAKLSKEGLTVNGAAFEATNAAKP
jgi:competence protein ComEA